MTEGIVDEPAIPTEAASAEVKPMTEPSAVEIPEQLKSGFRFILVKPKSKEAFEKGWQETANYASDDPRLTDHLKKNGNYGVLPTERQLIVDVDRAGLEAGIDKLLLKKFGRTFTVKTPHGGLHLYYNTDTEQEPQNLPLRDSKTGQNLGHVKANRGGYTVGPGCSVED